MMIRSIAPGVRRIGWSHCNNENVNTVQHTDKIYATFVASVCNRAYHYPEKTIGIALDPGNRQALWSKVYKTVSAAVVDGDCRSGMVDALSGCERAGHQSYP